MEPRNRFQGMNSASLAGRYDNPVPTRFLAPIDCLKIPAQDSGQIFKDDTNGLYSNSDIFFVLLYANDPLFL